MTAPTRPSSDRKRSAILAAAAEAFRVEGFQAASMDRIAERAGVSKRTVYNHFASKDALFDVVVAGAWQQLVPSDAPPVDAKAPVRTRLRAVAIQRLDTLLDPAVLALFRSVLAESIRSPELGRAYRDGGAGIGFLGLGAVLEEEAARGRLSVTDVDLVSAHFWGLVLGPLFWPAVLGMRGVPSAEERAHVVESGLEVFLAAYARPERATAAAAKPRTARVPPSKPPTTKKKPSRR